MLNIGASLIHPQLLLIPVTKNPICPHLFQFSVYIAFLYFLEVTILDCLSSSYQPCGDIVGYVKFLEVCIWKVSVKCENSLCQSWMENRIWWINLIIQHFNLYMHGFSYVNYDCHK